MVDPKCPLDLEHLTKNYGDFQAVSDVSLSVRPGEVFGLLGPNGAGKTTIISVITTLEAPTKGEARLFGRDVTKNDRLAKALVGLVPQEIVNHGFFTVEEVLHFQSGYYGLPDNSERIAYLIERLGLSPHKEKKILQLSGGMKRRFLIAKALVHNPKLLLLDEPTAGVDIELRESLWEFVKELNDEGMTILLTTHYLEEAENLCDRVAIIDHGKLKSIGPTKQLIRDLTFRRVSICLNESVPIQHEFLKSREDKRLEFQIPSSMAVGELLSELSIDQKLITDFSIKEGTLEDAFRQVVRGDYNGK
jgi:ABC-2 type transport system ATP-binding protein